MLVKTVYGKMELPLIYTDATQQAHTQKSVLKTFSFKPIMKTFKQIRTSLGTLLHTVFTTLF